MLKLQVHAAVSPSPSYQSQPQKERIDDNSTKPPVERVNLYNDPNEIKGNPVLNHNEEVPQPTFGERMNEAFIPVVNSMKEVIFFDPFQLLGFHEAVAKDSHGNVIKQADGSPVSTRVPFIVLWLVAGAVYFTIRLKFISVRGFKHAIALARGKLDKGKSTGEVSHFQALSTALSGTIGLGNIAGVAIAITIGGPGATFWIILTGLLGMSTKFVECTLGVKYRIIHKDGSVSGGPMFYLRDGLKKRGLPKLGIVLSVVFALLCMAGTIGIGNMFQANQSFSQLAVIFPAIRPYQVAFAVILAIMVGAVIIGGIKEIAKVAGRVVPFMAMLYVASALVIILMNITHIGQAFSLIINGAFSPDAMKGGFIGVLIVGVQRAVFSNEAGVGSAAIAHSAVKTDIPITEGFVALLEPFIDTVVICTMTALVIIFTGTYTNPDNLQGAELTSEAFRTAFSWYPYLLAVTIFLFAFSTMISYSYYGTEAFYFVFGRLFKRFKRPRKVSNTIFQIVFLLCIIVGTVVQMTSVLDFTDMMILCMSFPNILGLYILRKEVFADLKTYWAKRQELLSK